MQLENEEIDAREARLKSPEVEGQEDWRTNPLYGFVEYIALSQSSQLSLAPFTTKIERWFTKPCILYDSTP